MTENPSQEEINAAFNAAGSADGPSQDEINAAMMQANQETASTGTPKLPMEGPSPSDVAQAMIVGGTEKIKEQMGQAMEGQVPSMVQTAYEGVAPYAKTALMEGVPIAASLAVPATMGPVAAAGTSMALYGGAKALMQGLEAWYNGKKSVPKESVGDIIQGTANMGGMMLGLKLLENSSPLAKVIGNALFAAGTSMTTEAARQAVEGTEGRPTPFRAGMEAGALTVPAMVAGEAIKSSLPLDNKLTQAGKEAAVAFEVPELIMGNNPVAKNAVKSLVVLQGAVSEAVENSKSKLKQFVENLAKNFTGEVPEMDAILRAQTDMAREKIQGLISQVAPLGLDTKNAVSKTAKMIDEMWHENAVTRAVAAATGNPVISTREFVNSFNTSTNLDRMKTFLGTAVDMAKQKMGTAYGQAIDGLDSVQGVSLTKLINSLEGIKNRVTGVPVNAEFGAGSMSGAGRLTIQSGGAPGRQVAMIGKNLQETTEAMKAEISKQFPGIDLTDFNLTGTAKPLGLLYRALNSYATKEPAAVGLKKVLQATIKNTIEQTGTTAAQEWADAVNSYREFAKSFGPLNKMTSRNVSAAGTQSLVEKMKAGQVADIENAMKYLDPQSRVTLNKDRTAAVISSMIEQSTKNGNVNASKFARLIHESPALDAKAKVNALGAMNAAGYDSSVIGNLFDEVANGNKVAGLAVNKLVADGVVSQQDLDRWAFASVVGKAAKGTKMDTGVVRDILDSPVGKTVSSSMAATMAKMAKEGDAINLLNKDGESIVKGLLNNDPDAFAAAFVSERLRPDNVLFIRKVINSMPNKESIDTWLKGTILFKAMFDETGQIAPTKIANAFGKLEDTRLQNGYAVSSLKMLFTPEELKGLKMAAMASRALSEFDTGISKSAGAISYTADRLSETTQRALGNLVSLKTVMGGIVGSGIYAATGNPVFAFASTGIGALLPWMQGYAALKGWNTPGITKVIDSLTKPVLGAIMQKNVKKGEKK